MSDVYLRPIRLDHAVLFLAVDRRSETFLLNSDRTLMAFRTLEDARASYPGAFVPMCSFGSRPDWVIQLDAALTWSAKPRPMGIESVDQSEDFGDVIEFLEMLEDTAICTGETLRHFQSAKQVSNHIWGANIQTIETIPELSAEESEQLRVMFEAGIAAVRRALPKALVRPD